MNKRIGDILISFQGPKKTLPTRSVSPWKEVDCFDDARVLVTEADERWRGFPLATIQDEGWQIWALGEFYGDKHPDLPNALQSAADLNGHFLVIAYEKQLQCWHVLTDRFGTVHAYLANNGRHAALGTFSPAVAEAGSAKTLDWSAVGGFFTFGFFLGGQTYWEDLQILQPASHLVLDQHGSLFSEEKTWTWHHEPDMNLSYDDAIDNFGQLFNTVVRDQVKDKAVALPLSGGLDSRSTLVPLSVADCGGAVRLIPFSYGYSEDSIEINIAKQLAHKRDLPLQTWTIQPYLFDQIEPVLGHIEGFHDLTLPRQAFVIDRLAEEASHVLAAHWGDVWLDDMGFLDQELPLSNAALASKLAGKFTKKGSAQLLNLFKDFLLQTHLEDNASKIMDQLRLMEQIQNVDFKVKAWKTQSWSFRWTLASLRVYQAGLFPLLPFYDNRMADFFCRIPSYMVRGRRLQIDYLKRFAPDLARVEWQPYGANLYQYQHYNSWQLPRRVLNKLSRIFSGKQILRRNWEVQFLNENGRNGLQQWLLEPGLKIHNYVRKKQLVDFVNDFYAVPDARNGYAVSMLLTFSAWLEAYD